MGMEEHVPPSKSALLRGTVGVIIVLFVGVMSMKLLAKLQKRPKKKAHTKIVSLKVETRTVSYRPLLLKLTGYGTTVPDQRVNLVPEVSGRVIFTVKPFKVGTFVRKGQLLLRINPRDYLLEYKRLSAQIASLKKQITIAQKAYKVSLRNLSRSKRLVLRRALDQSSYERMQQVVLDRSQRLESLHQALKVNQIMWQRARLNVGRTSIRAPFAARISRGQLTRGAFVAKGRSIATLESTQAVEIPISFPLQDFRKIRNHKGEPVSLRNVPTYLRSLPPATITANGLHWKGHVRRLGASIDLATRTLVMYVHVNLKKQKQTGNLLPGTFCHVSIPIRSLKKALVLPKSALYEKRYMYIDQQGKLARRTVEIAHVDNEQVVVLSGLSSGEKVILTPLTDPIVGTPLTNGK